MRLLLQDDDGFLNRAKTGPDKTIFASTSSSLGAYEPFAEEEPDIFLEDVDVTASARIAAQRAENLPKYEARVDAIRALPFGDRRRACRDQATTIFDLPEVVDVGEVRRAA